MKDKSKVLKMYGYYVRLIAIYKLRTSDGIFVISLMALSSEYCFLSHLSYSCSVIYGNAQTFFYAISSVSNSKFEIWVVWTIPQGLSMPLRISTPWVKRMYLLVSFRLNIFQIFAAKFSSFWNSNNTVWMECLRTIFHKIVSGSERKWKFFYFHFAFRSPCTIFAIA